MLEIKANIWDFHLQENKWIVIPTNGIVKKDGSAVMGGGLALDAAERCPDLPSMLGKRLKQTDNHIYYFPEYKILTFPTKHHWQDPSDMNLIIRSASELANDLRVFRTHGRSIFFYIPRIGCGLGGLKWHNVIEAVRPFLNEPEFIFVSNGDASGKS